MLEEKTTGVKDIMGSIFMSTQRPKWHCAILEFFQPWLPCGLSVSSVFLCSDIVQKWEEQRDGSPKQMRHRKANCWFFGGEKLFKLFWHSAENGRLRTWGQMYKQNVCTNNISPHIKLVFIKNTVCGENAQSCLFQIRRTCFCIPICGWCAKVETKNKVRDRILFSLLHLLFFFFRCYASVPWSVFSTMSLTWLFGYQ